MIQIVSVASSLVNGLKSNEWRATDESREKKKFSTGGKTDVQRHDAQPSYYSTHTSAQLCCFCSFDACSVLDATELVNGFSVTNYLQMPESKFMIFLRNCIRHRDWRCARHDRMAYRNTPNSNNESTQRIHISHSSPFHHSRRKTNGMFIRFWMVTWNFKQTLFSYSTVICCVSLSLFVCVSCAAKCVSVCLYVSIHTHFLSLLLRLPFTKWRSDDANRFQLKQFHRKWWEMNKTPWNHSNGIWRSMARFCAVTVAVSARFLHLYSTVHKSKTNNYKIMQEEIQST